MSWAEIKKAVDTSYDTDDDDDDFDYSKYASADRVTDESEIDDILSEFGSANK